jgi:Xaa-Pro aminopeptidase
MSSPPSRLKCLRALLRRDGLAGLLVTSLPNVRYLTGFTGSAGALLVDRRRAIFMTDFRYRLQAAREVKSCRLVEQSGPLAATLAGVMGKRFDGPLAFESSHLTVALHRQLARALPGVKLLPTEGRVETLRMVKDRSEVALLRRAIAVTGSAYLSAARILAGRREESVARALEAALGRLGAEGNAFPPIVAAGRRAALPHAIPGKAKIRKKDLVILDFGAKYSGYHADVSRTRLPGGGSARARHLCRIVAEAQRRAIAAVAPGVKASDVDGAARAVIAGAGYGDCFGHGTGHGVGLEVHERPSISPRSGEVLAPGMVFTVEPGIYVENFGGVRIEDMVLVTPSGCEIMSRSIRREAV